MRCPSPFQYFLFPLVWVVSNACHENPSHLRCHAGHTRSRKSNLSLRIPTVRPASQGINLLYFVFYWVSLPVPYFLSLCSPPSPISPYRMYSTYFVLAPIFRESLRPSTCYQVFFFFLYSDNYVMYSIYQGTARPEKGTSGLTAMSLSQAAKVSLSLSLSLTNQPCQLRRPVPITTVPVTPVCSCCFPCRELPQYFVHIPTLDIPDLTDCTIQSSTHRTN